MTIILILMIVLGLAVGILSAVKAYTLRELQWYGMEMFFYVVSGLGWMVALAAAGELWFS